MASKRFRESINLMVVFCRMLVLTIIRSCIMQQKIVDIFIIALHLSDCTGMLVLCQYNSSHNSLNHMKVVMELNTSSKLAFLHTTSKEVGNQPNEISHMHNNTNCHGIKHFKCELVRMQHI